MKKPIYIRLDATRSKAKKNFYGQNVSYFNGKTMISLYNNICQWVENNICPCEGIRRNHILAASLSLAMVCGAQAQNSPRSRAPSQPDLVETSDTGKSKTDNITKEDTPTFSGTAEASSTVEVFADGASLGTTTALADGSWSFTPAASMADGTFNITAKATSSTGITSPPSRPLRVEIDTQKPVVTNVATTSHVNAVNQWHDSQSSYPGVIMTWNGTDSASGIDGYSWQWSRGNSAADPDGTKDGSQTTTTSADLVDAKDHRFSVLAIDVAGNIGDPVAFSGAIWIDLNPPKPISAVSSPAKIFGLANFPLKATITITFSDERGMPAQSDVNLNYTPDVRLIRDGTRIYVTPTVGTGWKSVTEWEGEVSVASGRNGEFQVQVRYAKDNAGNMDNAWVSVGSVIIDTERPRITSVTPYPPVVSAGNVFIQIEFEEEGSGVDTTKALTVEVDTATGGPVAVTGTFDPSGLTWSGNVDLDHSVHGTGTFDIKVSGLTDKCGHVQNPAIDTTGSVTVNTTSQVFWPVPSSDDILHMWGHPIQAGGGDYYHQGIDIRSVGTQTEVVAALSGTLARKHLSPVRGDSFVVIDNIGYSHCEPNNTILGMANGSHIAAGTPIGYITHRFFSSDHHLHFGAPFGVSFDNPLLMFDNVADRDPGGRLPELKDINGDSYLVLAVESRTHNANTDYANLFDYKNKQYLHDQVDLLVEVQDDMTAAGGKPTQAPHHLGYWIEGSSDATDGHNVKTADSPYMLHVLTNRLWNPQSPSGVGSNAGGQIVNHVDLNRVAHNYTWHDYHHFVITNASSNDGQDTSLDDAQFWYTKAKKGTGEAANGSDADEAEMNELAKFPDGKYQPHILMKDLVNATVDDDNTDFELTVDNFVPFVKKVVVKQNGKDVYVAEWKIMGVSNNPPLQLTPVTQALRNPLWLNGRDKAELVVTFSEEMKDAKAYMVDKDDKEVLISLTKTDKGKGLEWKGELSNAMLETHVFDKDDSSSSAPGMPLRFEGEDLAENKLDTNPATIGKRAASGWPRLWVPGSNGYDSGVNSDHKDRYHFVKLDSKNDEKPTPELED